MLRLGSMVILGFIVGVLSGFFGIGSGFVLVPLLVYLYGMNRLRAHGTSLVAISVISLAASGVYGEDELMDWSIALWLALGGVIGAAIGGRIARAWKPGILLRVVGALLVVVGIKMIYDAIPAFTGAVGAVDMTSFVQPGVLAILGVGILAGILGGLSGLGGGIVLVPALVLILGFPQTMAQGISLAVIIPASLFGALIHGAKGTVKWDAGIALAIGGVIGGIMGVNQAVHIDQLVLHGLFGVLVLVVGVLSLTRKRDEGATGRGGDRAI